MLFERKNKERVVSVVGVNTTGRSIVIGEELATYDKVIMLEMLDDEQEKGERIRKVEEECERAELHWESFCH